MVDQYDIKSFISTCINHRHGYTENKYVYVCRVAYIVDRKSSKELHGSTRGH